MIFFIDIRYEDPVYSALVHLATTIDVKGFEEANLFSAEIEAGLRRENISKINIILFRIDNNPILKENVENLIPIYERRANAKFSISQYVLNNPDQEMTLMENLTDKLLNGEKAVAKIARTYNIPAKVRDKETNQPLDYEVYYSIEHLIPFA